jgi:hypothetical protein
MGRPDELIPKPLPENPKGFFENYPFRKINDELLERSPNNYTIKSWSPEIPKVQFFDDLKAKARELILTNCERNKVWGWKDPRTCITSDLWLNEIKHLGLIDRLKVVYIFRSPRSVAASLWNRNRISEAHALSLWLEYNRLALSSLDNFNLDIFFLCYEDLCRDLETSMQNLFQFFELQLTPDLSFFDASLDHSGVLTFDPDCQNTEASRLAGSLLLRSRR